MSMYSKAFSAAAAGFAVAWLGSGIAAQQTESPANIKDVQEARQSPGGDAWDNQNDNNQAQNLQQEAEQRAPVLDGEETDDARRQAGQQFGDRASDQQRSDQLTDDQAPTDSAQRQQQSRQQGQFSESDTPPVPEQARDATQQELEENRDADWRMSFHNGEWWYYTADGDWMYHRRGQWQPYHADEFQRATRQGFRVAENQQLQRGDNRQQGQQMADQQLSDGQERYSAGYRGMQQEQAQSQDQYQGESQQQAQAGRQSSGHAAPLFYDRCGRPYICENGRRVYVQIQSSHTVGYRGTMDQQAATYNDQPGRQFTDERGQQFSDQRSQQYRDQRSQQVQGSQRMDEGYRVGQRQAPPLDGARSGDQTMNRDDARQDRQSPSDQDRDQPKAQSDDRADRDSESDTDTDDDAERSSDSAEEIEDESQSDTEAEEI